MSSRTPSCPCLCPQCGPALLPRVPILPPAQPGVFRRVVRLCLLFPLPLCTPRCLSAVWPGPPAAGRHPAPPTRPGERRRPAAVGGRVQPAGDGAVRGRRGGGQRRRRPAGARRPARRPPVRTDADPRGRPTGNTAVPGGVNSKSNVFCSITHYWDVSELEMSRFAGAKIVRLAVTGLRIVTGSLTHADRTKPDTLCRCDLSWWPMAIRSSICGRLHDNYREND